MNELNAVSCEELLSLYNEQAYSSSDEHTDGYHTDGHLDNHNDGYHYDD